MKAGGSRGSGREPGVRGGISGYMGRWWADLKEVTSRRAQRATESRNRSQALEGTGFCDGTDAGQLTTLVAEDM